MISFNYHMAHIFYQISKIIFSILKKKHNEKIANLSIRIYVNKSENRTFKIKAAYYLELLTAETMKLLGSTENEITKNKNCENVPHVEITEVVLVHCNIYNNNYIYINNNY